MESMNKILYVLLILSMIISINSASGASTVDIQDNSFYNDPLLTLSEQIQKIIDNAMEGTTINFLGTSYTDLTLVINKALNIVSNTGTTIQNSDSNNYLNAIFFINGTSASGTTISGFNLINDNTNGNGITINSTKDIKITKNSITANSSGIYVDKSSNIVADNNNIKKSDKGVYVKDSQDITIEKNTLSENNEGVYLENTSNTAIENNTITKSEKNGITIKNTRKTVIEYNNINQNKKNGIYSYNTENTNINYNNIRNNGESGILTESSAKDLNIARNNISDNHNGIRLDSSDNSGLTIKSNSINKNYEGMNFGAEYVDSKSKDISSNDISQNSRMNIENRDSQHYGTLEVGANWYGANSYGFAAVCPMLQTGLVQFNFVKSGNGLYTGTLTYNGQIMSDLPPMSLFVRVNGQGMWVNIEGGKATVDFGSDFDEKNAGSVLETFLNNQRNRLDISYDRNNNINPIIGGTGGGSGGTGGDGTGGGNGFGDGPGNTQGTGASNSGTSSSTSSPGDAGASSSGNPTDAQSSQQQSGQAKEIIIDDDYDLFRLGDVRNLTAIIIILLFGSIIIGYVIKKRNKKTSL